jgi:hypothetical protein
MLAGCATSGGGYGSGDSLLQSSAQGCTDTNALIEKGGLKSLSDVSLTHGLCVYSDAEMHQPAGSPGKLECAKTTSAFVGEFIRRHPGVSPVGLCTAL